MVAAKKPRMKRGMSATSPQRIASIAKQREALEYRKMGLTYAQIGERLKMSAQGAHNAIRSALTRTIAEPADDVRRIELERLDAMFVPVYANAVGGDLDAISTAINIMNRRAKLLGLDAAEKREHTGKDGAPITAAVAPTLLVQFVKPNEAAPIEAG